MKNLLLSLKKISSNQLFSNFFNKTIVFTKFLWKKCEREFLQFPHCALWAWSSITFTIFTEKWIFSVKSTFLLKKLLKSWFHGKFLSVIPFFTTMFSINIFFCKNYMKSKYLFTKNYIVQAVLQSIFKWAKIFNFQRFLPTLGITLRWSV